MSARPRLFRDIAAALSGIMVAVIILSAIGYVSQRFQLWGTSSSLLDAADPGSLARYGGTLTVVRANQPVTFNPLLAADTASLFFITRTFNNLFTNDVDTGTVADLVETWTSNTAGTVWTFKLRREVRWHDGVPFTADDVQFTYEQLKHPAVGAYHQVSHLFTSADMTVEATGTHTLRLTLSRPVPSLISLLTVPIIPQHIWEHECLFTSRYNRQPIGTGPFILERWDEGKEVVFAAYEDYFDGRPYVDHLVFKIEPDAQRRAEMLASGAADAGWAAAPLYYDMVKAGNLRVYLFDSFIVDLFGFNVSRQPFDDVRVRQAIAHAANVPGLIQGPLRGVPRPALSHYPPLSQFHIQPSTQYPYDLDRAHRLLEEAGFTADSGSWVNSDRRLSVNMIATQEKLERVVSAQYLLQRLRDLGIDAECHIIPEVELLTRVTEGSFETALFGIMMTPNPDQGIVWGSDAIPPAGMNVFRLIDHQVDQLLADGRSAVRLDSQLQVYSELQERLMAVVPAVPLYVHTVVFCLADHVMIPFEPNAAGEMQYVARWHLTSQHPGGGLP